MSAHGGRDHGLRDHRSERRDQAVRPEDLQVALDHIDAAARLLKGVQAVEESGARWADLETARRSLHGAAIAVVDCGLHSGREVVRTAHR